MNSFMGIEIGKRSVLTHQAALDITGHNIANANTAGYTRQVADLVSTQPWHAPMLSSSSKAGQLGTGVDLSDIQRVRDQFLDSQIRNETKSSGYWTNIQDSLAKIETILNEPSDEGLRSVIDSFWEAWQDLSTNPESEAVRTVVAQRGLTVSEAFNHMYNQLTDLRQDVNDSIKIKVDQINSIAQQITDLNKQILSITVAGKQPNDLCDKRDYLIDELSQIAEVKTYNEQNGMMTIRLGERTLVQGVECNKLSIQKDIQGMSAVIWEDTGIMAKIDSGELKGLLDIRGKTQLETDPSPYKEIIPDMLDKLNTMAKTIVLTTNELHQAGFSLNNKGENPDGTNFFVQPDEPMDKFTDWAASMKVRDEIVDDGKNIAAATKATWSTDGKKANFGDGSNALKIAQLKQSLNSGNSHLQTENIALTANDPISFMLKYGEQYYKISSVSNYTTLDERALAIQNAINTAMGDSTITVSAEGEKLMFSSSSNKFAGIYGLKIGASGSEKNYGDYAKLLVQDATVDDYWRSVAADIGVKSQESERMVSNQETLINQLENKRQSLSGVSLDEEMTNMIKYQHAYNAAARFITTIDETLDTVVNRLGTSGR